MSDTFRELDNYAECAVNDIIEVVPIEISTENRKKIFHLIVEYIKDHWKPIVNVALAIMEVLQLTDDKTMEQIVRIIRMLVNSIM